MNRKIGTNRSLRVVITSPSLNEHENVSGIASIVREIIEYGECDFIPFTAGRKDTDKLGFRWIIRQVLLPGRFFWALIANRADLVHLNTAFSPAAVVRDFTLALIARFLGFPVLLHIHGGKYMLQDFKGATIRWLADEMLHLACMVIVLNEAERSKVTKRVNGVKIEVLANSVSTEGREYKRNPNQVKQIIYFGRIDRAKGLDEIRRACQELHKMGFDFRFTCYGAGPQTQEFTRQMKEAVGNRYEYRGVVAGADKWRALKEADIMLLPSYYEGLPLSVLEAMSVKCIVIASNVGAVGTVIEDGVNGFLVEPHRFEQIVEKLRYLLSGEADWNSIRDRARISIERGFSFNDYSRKLQEHYNTTLLNCG